MQNVFPPQSRDIFPAADTATGTAMQRETILLITSTIAPAPGTSDLKITDPAARLVEYCKAFDFYLGLLEAGVVGRIVYADNSGHPLDALAALAAARGLSSRVEFLSFRAEPMTQYGRFYLEMRLIDTAFRLSQVLDREKEQVIWKVTGRYLVQNLARIIRTAPAGFDLYVNCRDRPVRKLDFYVVGFRSRSYGDLMGRDLDRYRVERPSGEILLREQIDHGDFPGRKIVPRLRVTPMVTAGRRGNDGASYWDAKGIAKYVARRVASRIAPWLWV